VVGLVLLVPVTGCARSSGANSAASPPAPSPTRLPAGYAGGACQLLDYDVVDATIGTSFDVAASSDASGAFTCVLQQVAADLPDLSLAVTPTLVDAPVFKTSVIPKKATSVSDLGKAAYSLPVAAGGGAGPGAEVGWLSGNQRLLVLRYRGAPGTAAADVSALLPKLVALAKKIDQASV
jgi:hypothetical protein